MVMDDDVERGPSQGKRFFLLCERAMHRAPPHPATRLACDVRYARAGAELARVALLHTYTGTLLFCFT